MQLWFLSQKPAAKAEVFACHDGLFVGLMASPGAWFKLPNWSLEAEAKRTPRNLARALAPLHPNWPQQLRFEEPAPKGRQDDGREADHGGIDQQARTSDHPGLEKAVAEEKQDPELGKG